jgi:hypothetical protein
MFQALLLMFEGGPAWDRIVLKEQGFVRVLLQHLLPMMVITTVLEGWGLNRWGKWQPGYQFYKPFSTNEVLGYEAAQFTLNLLLILVCARLVQMLGRTFHGRITYTYTRSFTSLVYGLSPMFLLRLLDPFAGMSPYVTWSIGILLSIWTLYDGLPRLLAPDPTHALGLYVSCSFVLFMATGLVRAVTAMYLQGNAGLSHSYLGGHLLKMIGP